MAITPADPILCNFALLTQPAVLAGSHLHVGMRFYWVLLANGATYALLGLLVESSRKKHNDGQPGMHS